MKNNGNTSRAEFRAIVAIAGILVLSISFPYVRNRSFPAPANPETALTLNGYSYHDTSQLNAKTSEAGRRSYHRRQYPKKAVRSYNAYTPYTDQKESFRAREQQKDIACSAFDPNTVSREELVDMGVSIYVTNNLIKYRESGAKFRKAEDIQKIYGMDSTLFASLISCIQIQSDAVVNAQMSRNTYVEINTAGPEEWKSLPGIGEVLASRIVKYRDCLGGFYTIQQVGETYGLLPETFQQITSRLVMESGPRQFNLNTATTEELSVHPYVTQRQAEAIVNFRNHHGNFGQIEEVLKIYSLNNDWFARMQPYLACNANIDIEDALVVR
ncbi:MAG TPA: helix-hairpin-helix domain-containing protein [Saprospiraceae bacterium]|nr:helix-hairpin-helix domain-containing protein [Saprospiraceae bacterium]